MSAYAPVRPTLEELNDADRAQFTAILGGIFESSPWVPWAVVAQRPFPSVAALHAAMARAVRDAPVEQRLTLIRAHPDLAGRLAETGALTPASTAEQASAGLDRLDAERRERFATLNDAYRARFGFPFVICAREHTADSILDAFEHRLGHDRETEIATALEEIEKIAALRLADLLAPPPTAPGPRHYRASYGKAGVPVYRVQARPLVGVPPVPESAVTGADNVLFAVEVDLELSGDNFLPSYTEGDNSAVVATDSMKNFILRRGLGYDGATVEGFLADVGRRFLETYGQVESLRVAGRELRFDAVPVPGAAGFEPSAVLRRRVRGDHTTAELIYGRDEDGAPLLLDVRTGRVDLELLKVTGSAFTRFVRDEYTTLPERGDRPLYIHLDVDWRYERYEDAVAGVARYVPPAQVADVVAVVFHELVSESIQHLVHEMGARMLERYPQLVEVGFTARNLTRDPVAQDPDDERIRVYTDPFPAAGTISLTVRRGSA